MEENKVLIQKDGSIYVVVAEEVTEQDVYILLDKINDALEKTGSDVAVLVNVTTTVVIRSSNFRKNVAERIKDIYKEKSFKKVALLTPSLATRTIVSFIVAITGLSNIKVFKSADEAEKWIKEP